MKVSRRNFMKLFSAATIVPFVPFAPKTEIIAEAEYGFTWGAVKATDPTFDELIRSTLRTRSKEIVEGLSKSNTLLLKLTDKQAIRVNKIDPDVQTKRMIEKVNDRRKKFDHELRTNQFNTVEKIKSKPLTKNIFHEPYSDMKHILES